MQRFLQAKAAPGLARPSWDVLADLAVSSGDTLNVMTAGQVFAALAAAHPGFTGMSHESLGLRGHPVSAAAPAGAAS